uniref:Uncharacterized protein n=1 Tax=Nelumbo nucifera TaxID=4432 RepID=A0A822YS97_NELNU|nr:TPA_asm: hypothetical protein HUJ06_006010 [Nelumbo nucifera]
MRVVFLGGSSTRRECCGTDVFLPRRMGSPAESRKKPACSTVLLPARVVHALKLNFDDMGARPRIHGVFAATENGRRVIEFPQLPFQVGDAYTGYCRSGDCSE